MQEFYFKRVLMEHHITKPLLGLAQLLAILAERVTLSLPRTKLMWLSCLICSKYRYIPEGINEQLHSVYCIYLCANSTQKSLVTTPYCYLLSFLNIFWIRLQRITFSSLLPAAELCGQSSPWMNANINTVLWAVKWKQTHTCEALTVCILFRYAFFPFTFYFLICIAQLLRYPLHCVLIISRVSLLQISGLKTKIIL